MVEVVQIDDPGDPRVGDFYRLNDPELRRLRERPAGPGPDGPDGSRCGFFVAEGTLVIRQLLASPYRVRSLLLTAGGLAALAGELDGVDAPAYLVSQEGIRSVTGFSFHRGALACADRRPSPPMEEVAAGAELVVVAEGVNDNENLGALFRNAAAFGAGAVVMDRGSADPFYRRAVRVSMGHVLRIPSARVAGAPQAAGRLRAMGFEVLALTPAAGAEDVRTVGGRGRRALLVGSEGPGLTADALAAADRLVRIPMAPGVDSLNVATAAAVALSHLARRG